MVRHAVAESDLSVRAIKRLQAAGVQHLEDLPPWTPRQLLQFPGFGRRCLQEVESALAELELSLTPDPLPPPRADSPRQRRDRLEPERIAAIRRLFKSGTPIRTICREVGCCPRTVYRYSQPLSPEEQQERKRAGGKRGGDRKCTLPSSDVVARELPRCYLTAPDAARELGISRYTMNEYLRAGKFPDAFQIGTCGWWLVPRAAVAAYAAKRKPRPA